MKKIGKKKLIIWISIAIAMIIGISLFISIEIKDDNGNNYELEIVPQEEISDEQLRETIINLYFVDGNNEIIGESRKIDSKNLIKEPYVQVLQMLFNGPKNEEIKTYIPENVKVNSAIKDGECLLIDVSKEFIEKMDENQEHQSLVISQIVNTMTQFSEINCVKIIIDGEANCEFKGGNIRFEQLFFNED